MARSKGPVSRYGNLWGYLRKLECGELASRIFESNKGFHVPVDRLPRTEEHFSSTKRIQPLDGLSSKSFH